MKNPYKKTPNSKVAQTDPNQKSRYDYKNLHGNKIKKLPPKKKRVEKTEQADNESSPIK